MSAEDITIDGVVVKELVLYKDERGWLTELFRDDEIDGAVRPAMSYVSMTEAGVARGPHEHKDQTDYFCFVGPSTFRIYLWDNRGDNRGDSKNKMVFEGGAERPLMVIVPPGVVHAYKNVGEAQGLVFNAPNRLFMGKGKSEAVDEIRHEDKTDTQFKLD